MKSNVNFVICLFFYFNVCESSSPLPADDRLRQKLYNTLQTNRPIDSDVNNVQQTNPTPNTFYRSNNQRYFPKSRLYESYVKRNLPGVYDSYQPPNVPLFPLSSLNQNERPTLYNVEDPYVTAKLVKPVRYQPSDQLKRTYFENIPVYPRRKVNVENNPTATNFKKPLLNSKIQKEDVPNNKQYVIIHPNGTTENVDDIESVTGLYPHYALVNIGNIIPIEKKVPLDDSSKSIKSAISELRGGNKDDTDSVAVPSSLASDDLFLNENMPTTIIEIEPQYANLPNNNDKDVHPEKDINALSPSNIAVLPEAITQIKNQTEIKNDSIISSHDESNEDQTELIEDKIKTNLNSDSVLVDHTLNNAKESQPNVMLKLLKQLPSIFIEAGAKTNFKPFNFFKADESDDVVDDKTPNVETSKNTNSNIIIGRIINVIDNISKLIRSKQNNETNPPNKNIIEENTTQRNSSKTDNSENTLNKSAVSIDTSLTNKEQNITSGLEDKTNVPKERNNLSNPQNESFIDEISFNPVIEIKDTSKETQTFADNSTQINKDDILNLSPTEIPLGKIEDANFEINQPISAASASSDSTINPQDHYEAPISEISTSTKINDVIITTTEDTSYPQQQPNKFSKIDEDFWQKLNDKNIPYDVIYYFDMYDDSIMGEGPKTIIYPKGTILQKPDEASLEYN